VQFIGDIFDLDIGHVQNDSMLLACSQVFWFATLNTEGFGWAAKSDTGT
jgi:hypothetical protein